MPTIKGLCASVETRVDNKISEVERKLEQLRFEIAVQKDVLETLMNVRGLSQQEIVAVRRRLPGNGSHRPILHGSVASAVEVVLTKENRPMSIAELEEVLTGQGLTSVGQRGIKPTISAALSRRKDIFQAVHRGVFKLKEKKKESLQRSSAENKSSS